MHVRRPLSVVCCLVSGVWCLSPKRQDKNKPNFLYFQEYAKLEGPSYISSLLNDNKTRQLKQLKQQQQDHVERRPHLDCTLPPHTESCMQAFFEIALTRLISLTTMTSDCTAAQNKQLKSASLMLMGGGEKDELGGGLRF